jgi:hypothetical protein
VVPQPGPGGGSQQPPPVTSGPTPREPDEDFSGPGPVVQPEPEPGSSPPDRPQPSPATAPPAVPPPPVTFSALRVVETSAGTASFTCSSTNTLALVSSSPAPGFKQAASRVHDSSRMDVTFVGAADKRIDARCRDGQVDVDVE